MFRYFLTLTIIASLVGSSTLSDVQPETLQMEAFEFENYPSKQQVMDELHSASSTDATYALQEIEVLNSAWDQKCGFQFANEDTPICEFGDVDSDFVVAVYGSSQAVMWVPALDRLGRDNGWKILSYTKPTCPAASTRSWARYYDREYIECDEMREKFFQDMEQIRPDVIFMGVGWNGTRQWDGVEGHYPGDLSVWEEGLTITVDRATPLAGRVIVVGEYVTGMKGLEDCLNENQDAPVSCGRTYEPSIRDESIAIQRRVSEERGAMFIDPMDWFCSDGFCPGAVNNIPVRSDATHANPMYVIWISEALQEDMKIGQ